MIQNWRINTIHFGALKTKYSENFSMSVCSHVWCSSLIIVQQIFIRTWYWRVTINLIDIFKRSCICKEKGTVYTNTLYACLLSSLAQLMKHASEKMYQRDLQNNETWFLQPISFLLSLKFFDIIWIWGRCEHVGNLYPALCKVSIFMDEWESAHYSI
jgi:hypothetical protein